MNLLDMPMMVLTEKYPGFLNFMADMGLSTGHSSISVKEYIQSLDNLTLEDVGLSRLELLDLVSTYLQHLQGIKNQKTKIDSLTILGGLDKQGNPEDCVLKIKSGEIVCIVGPTGSGKSRLLEDIEWLAQGDTPTRRKILIDDNVPKSSSQFSCSQQFVAQLSQHMNFVMDITVQDFIVLHAESRMIDNPTEVVSKVLEQANLLSGEAISKEMFVTFLSGGQSRALMIADIACLSHSPIVLIDEIENAGINRNMALNLLVKNEKIVLIATHDPILSLLGNKRIVMKNGGISKVIEKTENESLILDKLQDMEEYIDLIRQKLRGGVSL